MYAELIDQLGVLIDTWWNVNPFEPDGDIARPRFNRYMVECKYEMQMLKDYVSMCFNRYMVECKFRIQIFMYNSAFSFNRYMVECK